MEDGGRNTCSNSINQNALIKAQTLLSMALAFGVSECVSREVSHSDEYDAGFAHGYAGGRADYEAKIVAAEKALKVAGIDMTIPRPPATKKSFRDVHVAHAGQVDCSKDLPIAWHAK